MTYWIRRKITLPGSYIQHTEQRYYHLFIFQLIKLMEDTEEGELLSFPRHL